MEERINALGRAVVQRYNLHLALIFYFNNFNLPTILTKSFEFIITQLYDYNFNLEYTMMILYYFPNYLLLNNILIIIT